jgi:hypothetical protein
LIGAVAASFLTTHRAPFEHAIPILPNGCGAERVDETEEVVAGLDLVEELFWTRHSVMMVAA